jgi:hypothetical protein
VTSCNDGTGTSGGLSRFLKEWCAGSTRYGAFDKEDGQKKSTQAERNSHWREKATEENRDCIQGNVLNTTRHKGGEKRVNMRQFSCGFFDMVGGG